MSDIVKRLRQGIGLAEHIPECEMIMDEAADEIERLMRVLQEIAEDRPRSHPIDIARRALEGK